MKEAHDYMRQFKRGLVGELHTTALARIEAYNPLQNKADISLLPDGDLIKSVPVAIQQTGDFFIRIPYQAGDLVLVCFSQRDIDPVMYDNGKIPSERMLAMDDAIVIAGINPFNDPLPATDPGKLVIGQKDGGATLSIGDGEIHLTGIVKVNGAAI